jgi:benzoate membrane transport protein
MHKDASISAVIAGLIAVIISYAGPLIIVFQAAQAAHLNNLQLSSWIWAISIGSGATGLLLSLRYRTPVITAWSTPGAALLVASLPGIPYAEAIGAFLFSAALIALLGWSGLFDRIMRHIPKAITAAMLAGILFRFGVDVFASVKLQPLLVSAMFVAYLMFKRLTPRYAIPAVLLLGSALAASMGQIAFDHVQLGVATPVFTMPEFSLGTIVSLGIPLCLVTMTGQNVPGIAVLRTAGYQTPANPLVTVTGIGSVLLAPFGAHGINLAAITAAICTGREAHEEPGKRYIAGIACGVFYMVIGVFGATLAALFSVLPKALVATLAGLALFGAIMNGLGTAMADDRQRESALITFLVTASNITFLGLGAAFWGLLVGVLASALLTGEIRPLAVLRARVKAMQ